MKTYGKLLSLIAPLLLVGCHHDNPLKTQPSQLCAHFLMNASANAEKRLHFAIAKDAYGFGYLECMEGKKSTDIRCPELLGGMVEFAKENHYPAFKNLTLADLTDNLAFENLADDYAETVATSWPRYFPASPV